MGSAPAVTRVERAGRGWELGEGTWARWRPLADSLHPAHSEPGVRSPGVDADQGAWCRGEVDADSGGGERFGVGRPGLLHAGGSGDVAAERRGDHRAVEYVYPSVSDGQGKAI